IPAFLDIAYQTLDAEEAMIEPMHTFRISFEGQAHEKNQTIETFFLAKLDEYLLLAVAITIFDYILLKVWTNQKIIENYSYNRKKRDGTDENLSKAEIERWVSLDDKLHDIIPTIFSKNSYKGKNLWERYKRANDARDEFIHLKSPIKTGN